MRGPHGAVERQRIVLIGGGHTHVAVLRSFGMNSEPGVGLTVIAKELDAPYSGMLPGYVAGHYTFEQCHIDLVRLAQFAGARLIHGEAAGIDRAAKRVLLKGRPPLAYDWLSIDTGITPLLDGIAGAAEHAVAVKPVSSFAPRWQELLARALTADGPRRIVVVGTGAAGFELILAIRHRLLREAPAQGIDRRAFTFTLIGAGEVLPTHNARARGFARAALRDAAIEVIESDAAVQVTAKGVTLAGGRVIAADAVLVTTKAQPPTWFRDTGLPVDAQGFLSVTPALQSAGDPTVFAVGDCASVIGFPREKAGVFAVRQGPPLNENLRLATQGKQPRPFQPQSRFLTLLSLGDKRAIASRGSLAAQGAWAWTWKDRIDRTFMDRFNKLPMMPGGAGAASGTGGEPRSANDMFCAGCAAKLGPATLQSALDRLPEPPAAAEVRDLMPRDDAALVDLGGDKLRLETADQFPAIWPEPYVLGEIAAAHALSDILAKGGKPDHALALVQVARAAPHLQEDDLLQLMAGARAVLDPENVAVVGGHSGQGDGLTAGFFVSGAVARDKVLAKRSIAAGQTLILTKPIGTGILFAGWMRGYSRARHIAAALASMRQANSAAAGILLAHHAAAATDITGFGLAGHLLEMLEGSAASAHVDSTRLPLLPGALDLARDGVASTLLPENLAMRGRLAGPTPSPAALALLFDPQTSGGLLASVPDEHADACMAALRAAHVEAGAIGKIQHDGPDQAGKIVLTGTLG